MSARSKQTVEIKNRKLQLNKETIKLLTDDQLHKVAGGTYTGSANCPGTGGSSGPSMVNGSSCDATCVDTCYCEAPHPGSLNCYYPYSAAR
jgi:hypothetical protein